MEKPPPQIPPKAKPARTFSKGFRNFIVGLAILVCLSALAGSVCGSVAHAAVLCPSFYKADIIINPHVWDRAIGSLRSGFIGFLQHRADRKREARAF